MGDRMGDVPELLMDLGRNYPEDFYDFKGGVSISEERVQRWISEGLQQLKDKIIKNHYPDDAFHNISSGDTLVVLWAYRYANESFRYSITINVCKGHQELSAHNIFFVG